jgi:hypothetical protein
MPRNLVSKDHMTGSLDAEEAPDPASFVGVVHDLSKGGDVELIHALWHIAGSTWGKSSAAHHATSAGSELSELTLLRVAAIDFRIKAQDGEIEVRGRGPSGLAYTLIPPDHWRSVVVGVDPDPYRAVIKPGPNTKQEAVASLLEFDSLIVARTRMNELWPSSPPGSAEPVALGRATAGPRRRRGPPSFEAKDSPLVDEMRSLLTSGQVSSILEAATKVWSRAAGGGSEESKIRRLRIRYSRTS